MAKPKSFTEVFNVDPEQGAVAMLVNLSKPGYRIDRIKRKGQKVTVRFLNITKPKKVNKNGL